MRFFNNEQIVKHIDNMYKVISIQLAMRQTEAFIVIYDTLKSIILSTPLPSVIDKLNPDIKDNIINLFNILIFNMDLFDVFGYIYSVGNTYHISRYSSINILGQFFTPYELVDYCINLIQPEITNGSIKTMIDPFSGSGNFIYRYITYCNNKSKIDWDKEMNKIYGIEIHDTLYDILSFRLNLISPVIETNILKNDAFLIDLPKIDYIFSNPPFGKNREEKGLEYIMNLLNIFGQACVILPETIFSSKKSIRIRKTLLKKMKVEKVITIKYDPFFNTKVNTKIIIFTNSGKGTTNIIFSDLIYNGKEYEEKNNEIIDMKVIRENNFSLHFPDYSNYIENVNIKNLEELEDEVINKNIQTMLNKQTTIRRIQNNLNDIEFLLNNVISSNIDNFNKKIKSLIEEKDHEQLEKLLYAVSKHKEVIEKMTLSLNVFEI